MTGQLITLEQVSAEQIDKVNIETDQFLEAKYGMRIPVLEADGEELCSGHFDRDAVINFIKQKTTHPD